MIYYYGVDLSLTGTGMVRLDEKAEIVETQLFESVKGDFSYEERISTIAEAVVQFVIPGSHPSLDPSPINIEGLAMGKKVGKILELSALNYHCRIRLMLHGYPYIITPPSTLKKFVIGKQPKGKGAKKELMLLHTFKKWGIEFSDNNLCDAYGLARMVYQQRIKTEEEYPKGKVKRAKRT